MKKSIAVHAKNISKKYILHHEKPTLTENLFKRKEEFWALKDINLKIKKGQKLGIIGPNGAGKSTLLKIICGISAPTTGEIETHGKIASLIDVEAGFHPDLTGQENVFINGLLLGMGKKEIKNKFDQILKFSGIGKFIDAPLNTYSSGMKLRLGFSVAVHSDPDILIIDEIISAGDEDFQRKSYQKMQSMFEKNKTIIFASHNLEEIKNLCPQSVLIEKGKIKTRGKSKRVISQYLDTMKKNDTIIVNPI